MATWFPVATDNTATAESKQVFLDLDSEFRNGNRLKRDTLPDLCTPCARERRATRGRARQAFRSIPQHSQAILEFRIGKGNMELTRD